MEGVPEQGSILSSAQPYKKSYVICIAWTQVHKQGYMSSYGGKITKKNTHKNVFFAKQA